VRALGCRLESLVVTDHRTKRAKSFYPTFRATQVRHTLLMRAVTSEWQVIMRRSLTLTTTVLDTKMCSQSAFAPFPQYPINHIVRREARINLQRMRCRATTNTTLRQLLAHHIHTLTAMLRRRSPCLHLDGTLIPISLLHPITTPTIGYDDETSFLPFFLSSR
jgi:hypothetical protein